VTRKLVLTAAFALIFASPASAFDYFVTKTADTNDGACLPGNCSLRDAVIDSNLADGVADVIHLPAGTYTLTGAAGEDAAASGDLDVAQPLSVVGAGAGSTIIDGANNDRIFDQRVHSADLTLSGLTLTHGKAPMGAAVQALGTVTLDGVTLTDNTSGGAGTPGYGVITIEDAAVGNVNLSIANSTISSNHVGGGSGGLGLGVVFALPNGNITETITNSTFSSNQMGGTGDNAQGYGAVFIQTSATKQLNLNISGSRFTDNRAGGGGSNSAGFGSSLFVLGPTGTATISDSSFTGGSAGGGGGSSPGYGAVWVEPDNGFNLTVARSTISSNVAGGPGNAAFGGAVFVAGGSSGSTVLSNTTISGNSASAGSGGTLGYAGGVYFQSGGATLLLDNSTLASNSVGEPGTDAHGGGLFQMGNHVTAKNTIFAGNLAAGTASGCETAITSGGHNIEDGTSCGFTNPTDQDANALLAPLGDYGGPTQTRALLPGSPAIDRGSGCPATDQRGLGRPVGAACDIGAYEFDPPVPTTGAAKKLTPTSALISGAVLPNLRPASFYVDYGQSTSYGSHTATQPAGGGLAPLAVQAAIRGLKQHTTYHYRLVAIGDDTVFGKDATFTTPFAAPALRRLRLSRTRFPAAPAGGSVSAARKTGTNISYTATQAGKTTFRVLKPAAGRRQGKRCRKPSARNRRGRKCRRLVALGKFTHRDKAGRDKLHFTGRVHRHKLAPGKYRLRATPRAHGKSGKSLTARFRIVR